MRTVALLAAALLVPTSVSTVHAQGTLTPPGAPAPTMKTLDQVEARTIVNATNTPGDATNTFIISAAGSDYLTGNITGAPGKHGISIQANDVTLDLNGFALVGGGGGNFQGINVPSAHSGFCIRNGSVRGWTDGGVRAENAVTVAEKLRLSENLGAVGLLVGNGSIVTDCEASGNGTGFSLFDRTQISNCISTVNTGNGFDCTSYVNLLDCTASRNGGSGIVVQASCIVTRCSATRNIPAGDGISAGAGCTIIECAANANGANGILVGVGSTVRGCTARDNTGAGVFTNTRLVDSFCRLVGNVCDANQVGVWVNGNLNWVDGNSCSLNIGKGIYAAGTKNFEIRNTAIRNGINFDFGPYDTHGPKVDMSTVYSVTEPSPWANFFF